MQPVLVRVAPKFEPNQNLVLFLKYRVVSLDGTLQPNYLKNVTQHLTMPNTRGVEGGYPPSLLISFVHFVSEVWGVEGVLPLIHI